MIKFIIEVSEEYINEHSDFNKMLKDAKNQEGQDAVASLAKTVAFSVLSNRIKEEGKKEFLISENDTKENELSSVGFDRMMEYIAAVIM